MMYSDQMPPLGTEVSVAIKLPDVPTPVEARGRVMRIDLPTTHGERQGRIGVEFERFAGRGEATVIVFLRRLDPAARGKPAIDLSASSLRLT